jgi:hypothetical protein
MGPGSISSLPLPQLLAALATACPAAAAYTAAAQQPPGHQGAPPAASYAASKKGTGGAATPNRQQFSLEGLHKLLNAHPGPLNAQSSSQKVAKFVRDRAAGLMDEECLWDAPVWQADGRRSLWELLLLMAQHQGQLKVSYGGSSGGGGASKAAVGLLKGAVTAAVAATGAGAAAAEGGGGSGGAGTPTAGAAAAAAAAAAGGGSGAGDSELLRIILPGGASGSGGLGGARVLAAQVPELQLAASAAEMQVCMVFCLFASPRALRDAAVCCWCGRCSRSRRLRAHARSCAWLTLCAGLHTCTCTRLQRLLLLGRRHEALAVALAGQLWGPALVLAYGYGECHTPPSLLVHDTRASP